MLKMTIAAAAFAGAAGFQGPRPLRRSLNLRVAEEPAVEAAEPEPVFEPAPEPKGPIKAGWLPFINAPAMLDGTLAGDVGFDPLGFSDSDAQLINMREAEVKHARLAMLAAIGWPMAEKVHGGLASSFGLDYLLSDGGRAPSVLNGGLGNLIIAVGLGFALILASLVEAQTLATGSQMKWEEEKSEDYVSGELGFDPLGLYTFWGKTDGAKFAMRTAELKNGRTAMMGITIMAISEAVTHTPVVEQSAWAFRPFWETVAALMQTI